MSCPVSQVTSGSPRMQTWPPGAQSTAGGTENQTACSTDGWLPSCPKESSRGGTGFHNRRLTQGL